eukprot:4271216-Pleurochrysis_carterae.AAC.4
MSRWCCIVADASGRRFKLRAGLPKLSSRNSVGAKMEPEFLGGESALSKAPDVSALPSEAAEVANKGKSGADVVRKGERLTANVFAKGLLAIPCPGKLPDAVKPGLQHAAALA